ncbi:MAG TPA: hypothetical protein VHU84_11510, partial [Lacipirellulaceae bacterium]|nr:hypothetical protein [Lacipirellulaceae bacterium]
TGQGTHREGFVVRFVGDNGLDWTGNFQPGLSGCQTILRHPNRINYLVIADGQAYVVDPQNPKSWQHFGGIIEHVFEVKELNGILLGNGLWFELLGPNGFIWRSRRISWDGMSDLVINGLQLVGKSWSPDNKWYDFTLALTDGSAEGGSYPLELR